MKLLFTNKYVSESDATEYLEALKAASIKCLVRVPKAAGAEVTVSVPSAQHRKACEILLAVARARKK
jgi:hypothetical protein